MIASGTTLIDFLQLISHLLLFICHKIVFRTLQWRHNERDGVSNHLSHDCLFRRRSKKPSKHGVTGLCKGNSSVTGEFPTQRASNAETVSIWWRHHESRQYAQFQVQTLSWLSFPAHGFHYSDVIMSAMTCQITGVSIVCSIVCSGADQRKHPRVTGLWEGNPPVTGRFPLQMASNAENVFIWWRHHAEQIEQCRGCWCPGCINS